MTEILVALGMGLAVGVALSALAVWRPPGALDRTNYAGRSVPAVLGVALIPAIVPSSILAAAVGDRVEAFGLRGDFLIGGVVVLWVVGYLDDVFGGHTRGLGGHLGSLLRGRPTTGILKLTVGVAAAVVMATSIGDNAVQVVASAVLIALSTNVWNALDVVPGRALKWGVLALGALLAVAWQGDYGLIAAAAAGACLAVLPFDLRERGMLGDAGSNPLGFVIGVGLALVLPTWGVVLAAALALLLQGIAETVTISRLVEATPPLRWFDRLGRRA